MNKRGTKFYRKNENSVMKRLGFKPSRNSGAGWIEKEDGENEYAICQLKSTDSMSISIKQKDLRMLEYHAGVSHKIPVFAIQFLNTGEVWCMVKPEDLRLTQENSQKVVDNRYFMPYNNNVITNTHGVDSDENEILRANERLEEIKRNREARDRNREHAEHEREKLNREQKERIKEQKRKSAKYGKRV